MNKIDYPDKKQNYSAKWIELRRRLEESRRVFEKGFKPTIEEQQNLLETRTKLLAQETSKENIIKNPIEVLEFKITDETYAIELMYIREVLPLKDFIHLSCTPPFIYGIMKVHGQILSIVDLKKFFEFPEKMHDRSYKVIVLHSETMEFGILADIIGGVRNIELDNIQPTLLTLTGIRERYLKGVTKERIVVLDGDKLLSDKNLIIHEEVNF